jgi:PAS domain S-box-containing protein
MDAVDSAAVQRQWLEEESVLLSSRMRIALLLCLAPIAGFAALDVFLAPPGRLPLYYSLKLVAVAIAISAFVFLRPRRDRASVITVAVLSIAGMYALSTISAILAREVATTPILTAAVALGTATLLPWGVVPQVVVVLIAALSTIATVYGATGSLAPLLQYPTVGLAIGLGLSVYVAAEFERSRRLLTQRRADQARAEAEERQLNEVLEARVAARTAALQRSEASLSALIENADDAIWSIDRDYRVTAFNSVIAHRFHRLIGGVLWRGRELVDRVPDPLTAKWRGYYDRGLAGERFQVEHSVETADGAEHFVTFFNPIVTAGEVTGVAIFSTDVTEQRRVEMEARGHQAELAHVLRLSTMGEMAAGLAHEINQPLAAIVNYALGCARRLRDAPGAVAEVVPVIDDIAAQALRAGEIIRRLRTLVRKEAPRQDWMDVDEVIDDALRLLEPEARDRGATVQRSRGAAPPLVMGDHIQIEQVLLNLMRNGIEAMAEVRGPRELHIDRRCLDGDLVELVVRDTGPGIPPGELARVFDPFFSTKSSGLGMGLSISRSIVEAHHGSLVVESQPDGGAVFRVILPVHAPEAAFADAMP